MTEVVPSLGRMPSSCAGLLALVFLLASCDDGQSPPSTAGGSSDQGNAIALEVRDVRGIPVGHARIRVRPDSWTPGVPLLDSNFANAVADANGQALVSGLKDGSYVIEALRDSLVGATGSLELERGTVSARLVLEAGSSLVLGSADPSTTGFALRGLDRVGILAGPGKFRFHLVPRTPLRVESRSPGRTSVHRLPALTPGTQAEAILAGDTLQLVSGSLADIAIPAVAGNLFARTTLDLVPQGSTAIAQRRLDDGTWSPVGASLRLDSTFGGMFRLAQGSWTTPPEFLHWNLWNGRPKEIFDFAADGTDTTGFPPPTLLGATRRTDASGSFLRLDSTQSVDWGLALLDTIPEGALEIRFRPGSGFRRDGSYSLVSNDASRLGIGYLHGLLYFVKSTDYLHRWITSPPGQLLEDRWYRILATWGPQGMTLSVDGTLVGWSTEISGYSPGTATVAQLGLKSGAKDSCCLEVLGLVSPQRLDGDIASVHLYAQQPIVLGAGFPRQCPDSVAGDLLARCGSSSTIKPELDN